MHGRNFTITTAVVAVALGTCNPARAHEQPGKGAAAAVETSWHSPSLVDETVTGPNGAVTTAVALGVNAGMGVPDEKVAEEVLPGVYALRGWGIAATFAIQVPAGWIIVDTGDSTRAAAEMRETLERTLGRKVKVAAILLTHWHYADGTGAWLDEGTEVWGHEHLDRNRRASTGVSVLGGAFQARAIAQFGVFHPPEGPDAFPNLLGFSPEKLLAVSSYQPPSRLFEDGRFLDLVIAGEPVQVAPNRSDTTDSVGFYLPGRRLLVSNFMVTPTIFNVYTLRGGRYRDPVRFVEDARWLESRNAEVLLDIHGPTLRGEKPVREAIERSADQVQLIHDQTLRLIAQGMDGREAAEALYMPRDMREGREAYGQVESHVRQVFNGNLGWFGGDVYEVNPLSLREEATRTIAMMGGPAAVRKAAEQAARKGGLANWRWTLKLTSLLLRLDPADAAARKARATASRALGQRTTSANARGFYVTEALQLEGRMMAEGRPVTLDLVRKFAGTPGAAQLVAATVDENLDFVRYLVDPRKAEGRRLEFTIAAEGDPRIRRVVLRNGVLVVSDAGGPGPDHVKVSRAELAAFVLGKRAPVAARDPLAELDRSLDRSHLLPAGVLPPPALEPRDKARYPEVLDH